MRARLRLMLITSPDGSPAELVAGVRSALKGGVTAVQVRRPGAGAAELLGLVRLLLPVARAAGALLIVNDRVDVALAAGADGVHLKRTSLPVPEARSLVGPAMLVGVSAHEEEEVHQAATDGADYAVFGPVFATPSKEGILEPRGPRRYADLAAKASIPVLALGGVDPSSLDALRAGPIVGIAVIRAILGAADPEGAARELIAAMNGSGSCATRNS